MSQSILLSTYLIQSDLHCISALETARHTMGLTYVSGLLRYKQTELTFRDQAPSVKEIDEALKASYFFVNPNKEKYILGDLPTLSDSSMLHIQVKNQSPVEEVEGLQKAKALFGDTVTSCVSSLIWVIQLNENAPSHSEVLSQLVETTSRKDGLLMNPVFETAEVLRR